ncbi:hypothetical protein [Arthrobacter glacialis]|uniref:hypothetical protein n=1 Tax=Arthrobacter glacialis TaxID=1664 RepID=UPI000CD3CEDB|nr:hypothetical protein [Arthrobacter glacialis]POH57666.1 hypothetical protein CVS28_14145 [Arthrobacter glacialis]
MSEDPIIHFEIRAATLAEIKEFTDEIQPDLGCRAIARRAEGGFVIDAYLPESRLQSSRDVRSAANVSLHVLENSSEVGRARQQEVGSGNRYAARGEVPRGLGRKE